MPLKIRFFLSSIFFTLLFRFIQIMIYFTTQHVAMQEMVDSLLTFSPDKI